MHTVINAACIYLALLLFFRLAGRRTVAELTTFDFVLVLIIAETTQRVMMSEDGSLTGSLIAILTLLVLDIALALVKARLPVLERWIDGLPTVLIREGQVVERALHKSRVGREDILESARLSRGIASMDEIRYAVLEVTGQISIIPWTPRQADAPSASPA